MVRNTGVEVRVRNRSLVVAVLTVAMTAVPLSAFQTQAPNISGNWVGKAIAIVEGQTKEEGMYAVLKQDGGAVTGTVGPRAERQMEIANGKIATGKEGTLVTFETGRPGHVIRFSLKLTNDVLAGPVTDEFYPANKITVEFKREKAK